MAEVLCELCDNSRMDEPQNTVHFEETRPLMLGAPKIAGLTRLLVAHSGGLIRNEKTAGYALLAFVALAIIISVYLWSQPPVGQLQTEEKVFLERGGTTESYDSTLFQR